MVDLVLSSIQMETLLDSDVLGATICVYLYLMFLLVASFINIYEVDEFEYRNNVQNCFWFKKRMFFIIQKSKRKDIVSKKTFFLEIIGYATWLFILVSFVVTLWENLTTSFIVLGVCIVIVLTFASTTAIIRNKTCGPRKKKRK